MEDMYWDMSEEQTHAYWQARMGERMDESWEVSRLGTVLKSYYWSESACDDIRGYKENADFMDFWGSKRPYGSKALPESIAFNLGWDRDRVLYANAMPTWVENEAMKLHELVLKSVAEDWESHINYRKYLMEHYENLAETRD